MTTKVRLIKLLSDHHVVDHPPVKRTPLRPAMLYLMELRSHGRDSDLPKKKRVIRIENQGANDLPQEIKITQLKERHVGDTTFLPLSTA